jgi:O-acetyl-ADP-ribose deacetylase (regulator of RNase III)
MVEIYKGDIFEAPIDIVIHQANCQCVMGAGIAKEIRRRYPRAYEVDQMTKKGDVKKLGQFTFALADEKQKQTVVNLYGQYRYGRDQQYTNYVAVTSGLRNILSWIEKMGLEKSVIGIKEGMGCRNAGGNWEIVLGLIKEVFENSKVKVLICK